MGHSPTWRGYERADSASTLLSPARASRYDAESSQEDLIQLCAISQHTTPESIKNHLITEPTNHTFPTQEGVHEKRRSISTKLGFTGLIIAISSTIVLVLCMMFLAFLWEGQRRAFSPRPLWSTITLNEWTIRSITITSLLLRWAVAAQISLASGALAAIALERYSIILSQAGSVAVSRNTHSSPVSLLKSLVKGVPRVVDLRIIIPTVWLLGLWVSSQFTSTILLFDVTYGVILGKPQDLSVYYKHDRAYESIEYFNENGLAMNVQSLPLFAEYREDGLDLANTRDTGLTKRAFLPFQSSQDRGMVQTYEGPGTVMDVRTFCTRPEFMNVTYGAIKTLNGTLRMTTQANAEILRAFAYNETEIMNPPDVPFICHIAYRRGLYENGVGNGSRRDKESWTSICITDVEELGPIFLVLNRTIPVVDAYPEYINEFDTSDGDGEWAYLKLDGEVLFCATLCLTSVSGGNLNITATSQSNLTEATLSWDHAKRDYNTDAIQQQLGVSTRTSQREHLALEKPSIDTTSTALDLPDALLGFSTLRNTTIVMCQFCDAYVGDVIKPHRTQIAIFQDILQSTNNIALAFQAFGTVLYSVTSASSLLEANVSGPARITPFVVVSMPTQWIGFIIVVSLAAVHFLLFIFVMAALFWKFDACLGNVWQMIAQLQGEGVTEFIAEATTVTDKEVEKWLDRKGMSDVIVGVEADSGGVVRLRRKGWKTEE